MQTRPYAKQLVKLSLNTQGQLDLERVRAVLRSLAESKRPPSVKLLKQYYRYLVQAQRLANATVEHAGSLSEKTRQNIQKFIENHYKRPISIAFKAQPKLVTGFVIRCADDVWDTSLHATLASLLN